LSPLEVGVGQALRLRGRGIVAAKRYSVYHWGNDSLTVVGLKNSNSFSPLLLKSDHVTPK
jgi:hypothetical protein